MVFTDEDYINQRWNWTLRLTLVVMNAIYFVTRCIMSLIYHKKPPSLPPIANPLLKLSAITLAKKIREGEITSYQVVEAYVKRIKEVNPYVNAVVEDRFEAALIEAKDYDEQLRAGKLDIGTLEKEKPLYGVPITVKEVCAVKGLSYTGGALARKGMKATVDGTAVHLIRNAGAIPLCVTNTPEMCSGFDTMNRLHGRTYSPYDGRYSSGGSSGGEGALLGAAASVIGIGSDMAGSLRIPALLNGVFAHKPTSGIIPIQGLIPYSEHEDFLKITVCGAMSRYAEDLDLSMKILTVECDHDLRLDVPVDVKQLRIHYQLNVLKGFGMLSADLDLQRCIVEVANHFTHRGIRTQKLPTELWPTIIGEIVIAMLMNVKGMPKLLLDVNNPELQKNPTLEFGKALIGLSDHTLDAIFFEHSIKTHIFFSDSKISYFVQYGEVWRKKLMDFLGEDGVLIYPTFRVPAIFSSTTWFEIPGSSYCAIMNCLGFPATHVPMGCNRDGLPVGVQVVAAPYQDRLCLAVAKELEKAFGGWVPPGTSTSN